MWALTPQKFLTFLKPFIEELSQEFYKAVENFSKAKEICTNLLKHSTIAETKVGKYLIQMFDLAEATNQEQVLREIIKRVLSIAEKKGSCFFDSQQIGDLKTCGSSRLTLFEMKSHKLLFTIQ